MRYTIILLFIMSGLCAADPQIGLGPAPTTSAAPSGSAGGDLAGTYPNPTIAGISAGTSPIVTTNTITGTQLISTIASGTAPLVVTSTTVVANLNASQLLGNTWASPGAIGATSPAAGTFTTITANNPVTIQSSGTPQLNLSNTGGALGSASEYFFGGSSGGSSYLAFLNAGSSTFNIGTATTLGGAITSLLTITNSGVVQIPTGKLDITTSTANGSVACVLTPTSGPTGASTSVVGWITIQVAGTNHYQPYW